MNNLKNKAGFTLVELIVVIAILAILAGVAIPAYSGYITKAQEAGDIQIVSAVNTAIQAALAANNATLDDDEADTKYDTTNGIVVAFEGTDAAKAKADYDLFLGDNNVKFERFNTITVTNGLIVGSYVAPAGGGN